MDKAPVLETERLVLRGHRESDLNDCAGMWSDPAVVRFIGGRPFSIEEVWARLLRYAGHWRWKHYGYWLIEEKKSGTFMGEVGFADYKRDIVPSFDGTPEMGWVFATRAHGQGYANEAASKVIEWAQANVDADRTVCLIHPGNSASIRLGTKLGFRELQSTSFRGAPTLLLERRL